MNSISVRDQIWPASAVRVDGELTVAGLGVRALASEFGTPLYVAVARVGGMPPERVAFHGNNKSAAEIRTAVAWGVGCIVLGEKHLELIGLHSHIGSQIFDLDQFGEAARRMVRFLREVEAANRTTLGSLDLGGGLGVGYLPGEKAAPTPAELADVLHAVAPAGIRLAVEPGRSIVAPTTVAVYEAGTVTRPPVVAVQDGAAHVIVRRETEEDLLRLYP
jgi:diaminopimelate decarboxylase